MFMLRKNLWLIYCVYNCSALNFIFLFEEDVNSGVREYFLPTLWKSIFNEFKEKFPPEKLSTLDSRRCYDISWVRRHFCQNFFPSQSHHTFLVSYPSRQPAMTVTIFKNARI